MPESTHHIPIDLMRLRSGFQDAIEKLPDYKRAAAWEYVNALGTQLKAEIDSLTVHITTNPFTQIACSVDADNERILYALDAQGAVWYFRPATNAWHKMPMERFVK